MNARRWAVLLCLLAFALLLLYPDAGLYGAREGLALWMEHVLPALFPFFVLSHLLQKSGVLARAGRRLGRAAGWLGLPGEGAAAAVLGMTAGYPAGAQLSGALFEEGVLSRAQMEQLCGLCNLASPSYLSGTLAASLLGVPRAGMIFVLCQMAGALLCSLLLSPRGQGRRKIALEKRKKRGRFPAGGEGRQEGSTPQAAENHDGFSLPKAFSEAIFSGMQAMLKVGGTLTVFAVLIALLRESGGLTLLTAPLRLFGIEPPLGEALLCGLLESSNGCARLAALPLPLPLRCALCLAFCAFGGCSVLMQTLAFAPVRPLRYWRFKALAALLSGALCYGALCILSPQAAAVGAFSGSRTLFGAAETFFGLFWLKGAAILLLLARKGKQNCVASHRKGCVRPLQKP